MLQDMYRYGDGTPFPLDENFIETLTTAVETCTNAFVPLTDLDARERDGKLTVAQAFYRDWLRLFVRLKPEFAP